MTIRDVEIKRLENYAKGLGLKVSYKQAKRNDPAAAWVEGGTEIILYMSSSTSKTQLILNFLHELCHHHDWVERNRMDDPKLLEALNHPETRHLTKKARKLIFEDESRASQYRESLAKTLGITLPYYKLIADVDFDVWDYGYFYEHGKYPTGLLRSKKRKELRLKYKKEFGNKKCLEIIK